VTIQLEFNKGGVPVKVWTKDIEPEAMQQLINVSKLPIVHGHVAAMPDVHMGIGATVGSVIPTKGAIIPAAVGVDGVTYHWAGDEHGRLDTSQASADIRVGDRIEFIPPHVDPTVNLYDQIYALRGDLVEAVWPIAARGKSQ